MSVSFSFTRVVITGSERPNIPRGRSVSRSMRTRWRVTGRRLVGIRSRRRTGLYPHTHRGEARFVSLPATGTAYPAERAANLRKIVDMNKAGRSKCPCSSCASRSQACRNDFPPATPTDKWAPPPVAIVAPFYYQDSGSDARSRLLHARSLKKRPTST